jgi:hypothetical protein
MGSKNRNKFLSQTLSSVRYNILGAAERSGVFKDHDGNEKPMLNAHTTKVDTIPLGMPLKIYPPVFNILMTCKPSTRLVLGYVFANLKLGQVEVYIPWQKFVADKIGNRAAYYTGIKDLIAKNFIQKKEGQTYFVNHEYVFKGNRANFLESLT